MKQEDKQFLAELAKELNTKDNAATANPEIHHIDELRPSTVSEVICVKCLRRWIAVYLTGTYLKDLHCPNCGPGFVINTGEIIK